MAAFSSIFPGNVEIYMNYWLMKTEPDQYSFEDLTKAKGMTDCWDGIRNYQARNFMRDQFKKGDLVFIYHSRVAEPAIVGTAKVVKEAYPDHTALDPKSKYFDAKSEEKGESRWVMVDVKAVSEFSQHVTLADVKQSKGLEGMALIKRGQRLSIQPVTKKEWDIILKKGKPKKV